MSNVAPTNHICKIWKIIFSRQCTTVNIDARLLLSLQIVLPCSCSRRIGVHIVPVVAIWHISRDPLLLHHSLTQAIASVFAWLAKEREEPHILSPHNFVFTQEVNVIC